MASMKCSSYDPSKPTPLLDKLPLELRNIIYNFLLESCPASPASRELDRHSPFSFAFRTPPETYHSNIQFANRQLYTEFQNAIHSLSKSSDLNLSFTLTHARTLTWDRFPSLRPHVNQITIYHVFGPSDKLVYGIDDFPYILLAFLWSKFERTLARRQRREAARFTLDRFVVHSSHSIPFNPSSDLWRRQIHLAAGSAHRMHHWSHTLVHYQADEGTLVRNRWRVPDGWLDFEAVQRYVDDEPGAEKGIEN
jgi:hypothetical protein